MMLSKAPYFLLGLLALLLTTSCATPLDWQYSGQETYTQTNLHPDPRKNRLFTINYQQPGLLPLGTKVRIDSITKKKMKFTAVDTGAEYRYDHHRLTPSFVEHLNQYFGPQNPSSEALTLSDTDQKGIKAGRATAGMSKRGVILAIGYPPPHMTPSTDGDRWTYWVNRWGKTFVVDFEGDQVVNLMD